ncbi:hypothetical protein PO909_003015 [Leuciscus waleckii]
MENLSIIVSFELTLDPFSIPFGAKYPIFLFGIFIYIFSAFCNLTLLILIIMTQSLHKPIYFIMFSLPLNDFIGITSMLPKVLFDIVTETNTTYYPLCVLQGFLLHMYGGGVLFILAAMAFDRYIAICMPLRYNALMTPRSRSDAKSKAINTCVAQLSIFIIYEVVGTFTILSHRFKNVNADVQKVMGMLIFLVPPLLNPIVYGLNSHELRNNLLKLMRRKISKM